MGARRLTVVAGVEGDEPHEPVEGVLHVAAEHVQVGDGEIDWALLAKQLDAMSPGVSFIPEIWQGHVNDGEGFWIALERLEQWF